MLLLALDIGSSSVKAGLLRDHRIAGRICTERFETSYDGLRAEVDVESILRAVGRAIRSIGKPARSVDAIALAVMSPAWVAMDKRGRAITPIVTHQDRRSIEVAQEIERAIGKARHLKLAGNRPFPGGISSTTWAWFNRHHRALMRRADLVGHLNTFIHRQFTHARIIDPSNAAFMGVYSTTTLQGWNEELMEVVGASEHQLPQLVSADSVAGLITRTAGQRFGLTHGTPMLAGLVDTGSAMLLSGASRGQLLNSSGSTDVLALCTDVPRPDEALLTRPLGTGRKWLSVSTIAAAGSAINWVREQFFADLKPDEFRKLLTKLARRPPESSVRFDPHLAGSRISMEQRSGAFSGLTLSTTRDEMLSAVIESLATASAARLKVLWQVNRGVRFLPRVIITGGVSQSLGKLLHRDWQGKWQFRQEEEASLRGLSRLIE
jgi:sugar (pentulose or hexulose) kinase